MGRGKSQIGFAGLGVMGAPMAGHAARQGWQIVGYDPASKPEPADGLVMAGDISELASCPVVVTCVPDGAIVGKIADQLLAAGFAGTLIDMSSSHPDDTLASAARLAAGGASMLDAPVSGGVARARSASLMIMVGGPADLVARHKGLLDCFGQPEHIGPLGAGHAMKALNNFVSAAGLLAAFQALATAGQYGIAEADFVQVINQSTGRNNTTEIKLEKFVLPRRFDSGFALKLMAKDVAIAADLMASHGFAAPTDSALADYLKEAEAMLDDGADHTALFQLITRS